MKPMTKALTKANAALQEINRYFKTKQSSILQDVADKPAARLAIRSAMIRVAEHEKLRECTPSSLVRSVSKAVIMGLDFERQHCYLVPFYNKKEQANEATLMVSYRGYQFKAGQSGYQIVAETVYDDEDFELTIAPMHIMHRPNLAGSKGKRLGAYAAAYRNGTLVAVTWCTNDDLDKARKMAEARKPSGAWQNWPKRMERKLPISRLCKELPDLDRNLVAYDQAEDEGSAHSAIIDAPEDLTPVVPDKLSAGKSWGFGPSELPDSEPPAA